MSKAAEGTPVLGGGAAAAPAAASGAAAPAAAGAAAPAGASAAGSSSWLDSLPKEFEGRESLAKFTNVENLAKSFVHLEKTSRGDKIPKPNQYFTEDDWSRTFKDLGLPESVDKYEVKLPKDVKFSDEGIKGLKEQAHKAGILPQQLEKVLGWYGQANVAATQAQAEAQQAEVKKGLDGLKSEWGHAFEKKAEAALFAVKEVGGEELAKFFSENGVLGNNPLLIKAFAKIAEDLMEDKLPESTGKGGFDLTPDDIDKKIADLQADPAYLTNNHPKHELAVRDMNNLWQMKAQLMTG
jgi:hypothetical protein